ncbi:nucleotide pyrophosphohydrolase [Lactobacillus alvi]|uniref:Nucleotide pyrophosphohydrolase n=1 Tax=Limosilactobacillus alvi TaxID=990412 RepID=A0ABS2ENX9_9LACO|nr:nucleotide pyrophosphohydrolase [Limosilactobacillus alvi]MBM6754130.1 nucleotide pyrophosphohydrolase [Limosilactobacillus alvi]
MDYQDAIKIITDFRKSRHWEKYHNLKDLALSANLEASEVLEIFQWKDEKQALTPKETAHLKEEIADTLIYLFYMCDALGMDPYAEIAKKMKINAHRHWDQDEE